MYLSREEVRAFDRRATENWGVPGVILMENAGRGAAEVLLALEPQGLVTICCGKGNNGGDGFVMARHLVTRHVAIRVLLFARPEELRGDAATHFTCLSRLGIPLEIQPTATRCRALFATSEWLADALFGTGLTGPIRTPFAEVVEEINLSRTPVLAVDLPSGLDCDTGEPLGPTVRAAHTVTFVAFKKGFAQPAAADWLGQVHVVNIGVPAPAGRE